MRQRGAERDPLLLAARELARARAELRLEADALEQRLRPRPPLDAVGAQPQADQLDRGQLGRERTLVVLVEVADDLGAVPRAVAAAERAQVVPEDADRPGRRQVEPGQDAKKGRLSRAARAEHGQDLAFGDAQGQALEGGGVALRRRVDPEDVVRLDRERAHTASP